MVSNWPCRLIPFLLRFVICDVQNCKKKKLLVQCSYAHMISVPSFSQQYKDLKLFLAFGVGNIVILNSR